MSTSTTITSLTDLQRSILRSLFTHGRRQFPRDLRHDAAIGGLMVRGLVVQEEWGGMVMITWEGKHVIKKGD